MINFLISVVVFVVSVFLLAVSIRYGLIGASRLDQYFSAKTTRNFSGYPWYYRIPFSIGLIPEYYFYLVIGRDNYFKFNWWPVKTSAFLSLLVALATLNSRTAVYNYFSFEMVRQNGFSALFTSGTFTWYMNFLTLLYLALFVVITIESIKMHGIYAPVRILIFALLSVMMANLTVIVLGLIVFITIVYIAFKIIGFLFFSSRRRRNVEEPDNETRQFMQKGFSSFKEELFAWEDQAKPERKQRVEKIKPKVKIKRKRPKISRNIPDDDIPGLHPD
jgi:hypothetical protein